MRKQTKLVAVLSAAALLAIGASMTSFAAAAHWDQQDGEWVYLDRNGDRVTDEWKKSNNQWYYLDADGFMAREQVIEDDEDKYYVDANGVRVTNAWVSMDNDDLLDDDDFTDSIDTVWMYFDGSGKAIGSGSSNGAIKKLSYGDNQSAYFIFNQDGYMLSGWQRWSKNGDKEKLYYLGGQNEGWAHTGWQYLEIDPDIDAFAGINTEAEEYEDEAWFYFDSNGKAYENASKTISGKNYAFDEHGRMIDLWVYKDTDGTFSNANGTSTASSAAYYQEDNGGRDKNWIYAYPKTSYDNYSDDPYWFYLDKNGKPFRADDSTTVSVGSAERIDDDDKTDSTEATYNGKVSAKSIKNQTYLFNDKGVMLTGLYELDKVGKGNTKMADGIYYFTIDGNHSSVEGQMVKNKRVTIDVNDEDRTYYFKSTGEAYTGVVINGYVYYGDVTDSNGNSLKGQMVTDYGDGNTYTLVKISDIVDKDKDGNYTLLNKNKKEEISVPDGDTTLLINEKGKIRKSGTVTDVNGEKVTANNYVAKPVPEK